LEGITAAATACAIARQGIAVVGSKMAAPSKSAGKSHAMVAVHRAGIPSADIRRILTVADPASPRQAYWTSKSARLSAYLCQDRAPDSLAHKPAFGTPLPSRQKILYVCSAHGGAYLWGLAAFGQAGVERILEILREETRAAMQQVGAPTIKHLTPAMVRRRLKGLLSAAEGSAQEGLV